MRPVITGLCSFEMGGLMHRARPLIKICKTTSKAKVHSSPSNHLSINLTFNEKILQNQDIFKEVDLSSSLDDQMLVDVHQVRRNECYNSNPCCSSLISDSIVSIPRLHLCNALNLNDSTLSRKVSSLDTGSGRRVGRKELKSVKASQPKNDEMWDR